MTDLSVNDNTCKVVYINSCFNCCRKSKLTLVLFYFCYFSYKNSQTPMFCADVTGSQRLVKADVYIEDEEGNVSDVLTKMVDFNSGSEPCF